MQKGFNRGPELNPGNDPYDAWHEERGGFRADWEPNHRDTLMVEGDIYQGEVGGQNEIGTFFPPAQMLVQGAQPVSGGNMVVRWNRTLNARSDFYLQAYFDRTNRKSLQFDETRDTFDVDFVDHIGYLPRQDIAFGGGRESPSNLIQTHATVNFTPNQTVNFTPNQLTDYIYSGFVQDRIEILSNRLAVILGTKIEDNNYSGVGVEPNARILWNPSAHQTLWGAVSRALRVPGRVDQDLTLIGNYVPSPPIFVTVLGNQNFKPEVMIGWEAGYRQLFTPWLYVDLSLFHNQYDDLESYGEPIFTVTFPTQPYPYTSLNATFANGVKGMTDGLELAPDWKPFSWLDPRNVFSPSYGAALQGRI